MKGNEIRMRIGAKVDISMNEAGVTGDKAALYGTDDGMGIGM